ncbi:MAG: HD domain-containing protein [Candidatus Margulisbacteria bacterium]|nr:HD domain-containing protein [Candidatus Margulisiibacteriota bacterium]
MNSPAMEGIRLLTIRKAGQAYRVPAERRFYIDYLFKSEFKGRIVDLADRIEALRRERGTVARFDREKFYEAAGLAIYAHRDQTRKISGAPFVVHPIEVAEREVEILHITDGEELIAALLHDVVEDTDFSLQFIKKCFGSAVAKLVDGLTKIEQLEKGQMISEENIDKFVNALARDIRVLRIKMVDRGVNLEDADQLSEESRLRNSEEALDFYVPLGALCGLMKAARHLSDIAFRQSNPARYQQIKEAITGTSDHNHKLLDDLRVKIQKKYRRKLLQSTPPELRDNPAARRDIDSRQVEIFDKPRTVYEVEQISAMRGTDAHKLSDIVMMQVTVGSIGDCYTMAEIIHSLGIPMDRYWHDYIKDPKINGYQSLHTGILVDGKLIRFQIRTRQMQRVAQEGVLHDAYTVSGKFKQPWLPWLTNDWLKTIMQAKNRREKIILTKSLAQARLATVIVEGASLPRPIAYDNVLLPRGVSPLEIAFIVDPNLGFMLEQASHYDVVKPIKKRIQESLGLVKLVLSSDVQYRDYLKLLQNPLARLRFLDHMSGAEANKRVVLAKKIFEQGLAELYLTLEDIEREGAAIFSDLTSLMFNEGLPAQEIIDHLGRFIRNNDEGKLVIERLGIAPGQKLPDALLDNLRRIFPIERYGFKGSTLELSVPLRSAIQIQQFANFMASMRRGDEVEVLSSEQVKPPIIDTVALNPHSLYYSHDLAMMAARALKEQDGEVYDINLNPPLLEMLPPENVREIDEIISRHIARAKLLFFSGHKEHVDIFTQYLRQLMDRRMLTPPLMVVFERKAMFDVEGIANSLAELGGLDHFGTIQWGHNIDFILACLAKRVGLLASR